MGGRLVTNWWKERRERREGRPRSFQREGKGGEGEGKEQRTRRGIDEVKSRGEEKRGRIESRRNHLLTGRETNENMYSLQRMEIIRTKDLLK